MYVNDFYSTYDDEDNIMFTDTDSDYDSDTSDSEIDTEIDPTEL